MDTPSRPRTLKRAPAPLDPDFASHIKSRLQDYSKTISALERYKSLCEERLLELAPGHPLPVLEEHLGKSIGKQPSSRKLDAERSDSAAKFQSLDARENVREEVERLRREVQDLSREKAEIERSLRAEVLHSEEQRALIEALKQAIESKMSSLGLTNISVQDYCTAAASHTQKHDSYITIARLQGALISQEEKIQSLEAQIASTPQGEVSRLQQELTQTDEALQHAISEMNKLEEEKNSLLDYIEDHKRQEAQLQEILETIEPELLSIKREHEEVTAKYEESVAQNRMNEKAIGKLEVEARDVTRELTVVEKRLKERDNELSTALARARAMGANQATLSETLQETQAELDTVKAANGELVKELTQTQETLAQSQQALEEAEAERTAHSERLSELQAAFDAVEESLKATSSQLQEALSLKSTTEEQLADTQQKLAKVTQTGEDLRTELHTTTLASANSSRALAQLQDELRTVRQDLAQASRDNEEAQAEKAKLVEKLESLVGENQALISELAAARQSDHAAKMESQQYRLESEEVRSAVTSLLSALSVTSDEHTDDFSIRNPRDVVATLEQVQRNVTTTLEEKAEETYRALEEVEKLMELVEKREEELTNSHQVIDELRAKAEHFAAVEKEVNELRVENTHFQDLDREKTTKMAQIECRISCLLRENEDLQTFAALVFKAMSLDDASAVLERMIRCVSDLQQLYKDQYDTEYRMLVDGEMSIVRSELQRSETHISAHRRNLMILGDDLKAVLVLEKRKTREIESQIMAKRVLGDNRRSDSRTLVDRLNLPKVRSEVMKLRSLDSV